MKTCDHIKKQKLNIPPADFCKLILFKIKIYLHFFLLLIELLVIKPAHPFPLYYIASNSSQRTKANR